MGNPYDDHNQQVILYVVDKPVIPVPDGVPQTALQTLTSRGTWIHAKFIDYAESPLLDALWQARQVTVRLSRQFNRVLHRWQPVR